MAEIDKQVDDVFAKVARNKGKILAGGAAVWLTLFALAVGVVGVVVWGFIRLVLHFT